MTRSGGRPAAVDAKAHELLVAWVAARDAYIAALVDLTAHHAASAQSDFVVPDGTFWLRRARRRTDKSALASTRRYDDQYRRCQCAFNDARAAGDLYPLHGATVEEIETRAAAGQRGWGTCTPREALAAYATAQGSADRALAEAEATWRRPVAAVDAYPGPFWRTRLFMDFALLDPGGESATFARRVVTGTYEDAGLHAEAAVFQRLADDGVTDADQLEAAIAAVCAPAATSHR